MALIEKAVILARGLGTRMRKQDGEAPLTGEEAKIADSGVKAMIPIDRPFLDYVLHNLAEAGYRQVCLVIGPEHEQVRDYYQKEITLERITVDFAVQEEPKGTADAVRAAEAFAGAEEFIVLNSDNYYPLEALKGLREMPGPGLAAFVREGMLRGSNIPAERLTKFAVIQTDDQGNMTRIIEKPSPAVVESLPEPVCVSMNCWRFGPSIFQACKAIGPSPRGEYEITDAVQYTIDAMGQKYQALPISAPVLDLSSRGDIALVKEKLAGSAVRI